MWEKQYAILFRADEPMGSEELKVKYILIHKLIPGITSQAGMEKAIRLVKELMSDPSSIVPNSNLLMSYNATNQWMQICIWDSPSIESFTKLFEILKSMGIATEIIPVEDMETTLSKWENMVR